MVLIKGQLPMSDFSIPTSLEEHIERTIAAFPPLNPEQLDRVAQLLRAGDAA